MCGNESQLADKQRRRCSGFTLLEVLVALTILAGGSVAVLTAFNASLRASNSAAALQEACDLAHAHLQLAALPDARRLDAQQGRTGRFQWSVQYAEREHQLLLATVLVQWSERGEDRRFALSQIVRSREAQ